LVFRPFDGSAKSRTVSNQAQIYVRVALKMISVETFLMKIHPEFQGG
jgi:hypothetical protein